MRSTSPIAVAAVLAFIGSGAASVHGQFLEPPPRSTPIAAGGRTTGGLFGGQRPIDPRSTQRQLTLSVNTFGGYDDNLSPQGGVPTGPFTQRRSATNAGLSSTLRFVQTGPSSRVESSAYANMNQFSSIGIHPLIGGGGDFRASKRVLARTELTGGVQGEYRPTFGLGVVGATMTSGTAAEPAPGWSEINSSTLGLQGSLSQTWAARQRTAFTASHGQNTYGGIDQRSLSGSLDHSWDVSRAFGLRGSVSASRITSRDLTGRERNLDSQVGSVGLEYRLQISRTRRATFSGGPAVTSVRTPNALDTGQVDYLAPSGFATVRVDVWRTWAVAADWRRETTVLNGLTRQSFLTNVAGLSIGGDLSEDTTLTIIATYLDGAPHQGDTGSFSSLNSMAQLQYGVSRCCSIFGNYSYGKHDIRDVASVPEGFPRQFERNAARVGMTLQLPLYGTFPAGGRRAGRGRN